MGFYVFAVGDGLIPLWQTDPHKLKKNLPPNNQRFPPSPKKGVYPPLWEYIMANPKKM